MVSLYEVTSPRRGQSTVSFPSSPLELARRQHPPDPRGAGKDRAIVEALPTPHTSSTGLSTGETRPPPARLS
eukprot:1188415-Prorocentrum_minimum.AAC.1